jgi:hypothetical protein
VSSQGQSAFIRIDLSAASGLVLHSLPLNKLRNYGLSTGYVNGFCSYLAVSQPSFIKYPFKNIFEILHNWQLLKKGSAP